MAANIELPYFHACFDFNIRSQEEFINNIVQEVVDNLFESYYIFKPFYIFIKNQDIF